MTAVRERRSPPGGGAGDPGQILCHSLVVISFLLAAPLAEAESGEPLPLPSLMTIELLGDESGQQDIYLSLDLGLPSHARLWFESGLLQGGSSVEDTLSLGVGVGSDPEKDFSAALRYRYREQEGAFRTGQIEVDFLLFRDPWMVSFTPAFRSITLFTSSLLQRRRHITEFELDSQGIELGAGYFGFPSWGLTLYHRIEDYSEDLSRIGRYPRLAELFFSQGALNLAWGLDRSQTRLGVTYYVPHSTLSLGMRLGSAVSAIDDSTYHTVAGFADWDVAPAWGITLEAGGADSDAGYGNRYLSVAFRHWW